MNIIKGRDSFAKRQKGWKGSLTNRREGRGFWENVPSFFLLPPEQNRGGGKRGAGGPVPGVLGLGGGRGEGRRGRTARGVDSPP